MQPSRQGRLCSRCRIQSRIWARVLHSRSRRRAHREVRLLFDSRGTRSPMMLLRTGQRLRSRQAIALHRNRLGQ